MTVADGSRSDRSRWIFTWGLGLVAGLVLVGGLGAPNRAHAGDEFERAFKIEMGRIAAHEAAHVGRHVLGGVFHHSHGGGGYYYGSSHRRYPPSYCGDCGYEYGYWERDRHRHHDRDRHYYRGDHRRHDRYHPGRGRGHDKHRKHHHHAHYRGCGH